MLNPFFPVCICRLFVILMTTTYTTGNQIFTVNCNLNPSGSPCIVSAIRCSLSSRYTRHAVHAYADTIAAGGPDAHVGACTWPSATRRITAARCQNVLDDRSRQGTY